MIKNKIKESIAESIFLKQSILKNESYIDIIQNMVNCIVEAYKNNKKLIICGNGGSASDALHIEAELLGRFRKERMPLPAIALSDNVSTITAIANDYNYSEIFRRQIKVLGNGGDILLALTTSGNSENIINAIIEAKKNNIKVLLLSGNDGGKCYKISDISLIVPSSNTARIQEIHIMIGHIICELLEDNL